MNQSSSSRDSSRDWTRNLSVQVGPVIAETAGGPASYAERDRHLEDRLDDLFHCPSAQMTTTAEIRHHRGQPWPDDVSADLRRDLATIEVAGAGAGARVSLVLRCGS